MLVEKGIKMMQELKQLIKCQGITSYFVWESVWKRIFVLIQYWVFIKKSYLVNELQVRWPNEDQPGSSFSGGGQRRSDLRWLKIDFRWPNQFNQVISQRRSQIDLRWYGKSLIFWKPFFTKSLQNYFWFKFIYPAQLEWKKWTGICHKYR